MEYIKMTCKNGFVIEGEADKIDFTVHDNGSVTVSKYMYKPNSNLGDTLQLVRHIWYADVQCVDKTVK